MSLLNKALLAASLAMVAIPVANALTISINDTTDPIPPPASEPSFEVSTVPPGIVGVFTAADLLIVVRDPGTTDVSDIISVLVTPHAATGTTDFDFVFQSDGETPLVPPATPPAGVTEEIITETGAFQTVYDSVDPVNGSNQLILRFASDVETSVPEPATFTLLGLGLAGLGFSRRRSLN